MRRLIGTLLTALAVFGLAAPAESFTLNDDFDAGIDLFFWNVEAGAANTISATDGRLVFTQGAEATESTVRLRYPIVGDFTATVDYELLAWPNDNEQTLALAGSLGSVLRTSDPLIGGEVTLADLTPLGGAVSQGVATPELSGRLRLRRTGTTLCSDVFDGVTFQTLACHDAGSAPDLVGLGMESFSNAAQSAGVQLAFDSFSLDAPDTSVCGDGVVELDEACDDGNTSDGDGCDFRCGNAAVGALLCAAAPAVGCIPAGKASLSIVEKKVGNEKLKAKLAKFAAPTGPADFGDPVSGSTRYDLCLYDEAGGLVSGLAVDRAQELCGGKQKPCWKAKGTKGYGFKDPDLESEGVKKIAAASGPLGKGKLQLQAGNKASKGQDAMPVGWTAALAGDVLASLQVVTSDGLCFEASLDTVKKNDGLQFKAKGGGPLAN